MNLDIKDIIKSYDIEIKNLEEKNINLNIKLKDTCALNDTLTRQIDKYEDERNKTLVLVNTYRENINELNRELTRKRTELDFNDELILQNENINISKVKTYVDSILFKLKEKYKKYETHKNAIVSDNKTYEEYKKDNSYIFFKNIEVYKVKIKELKTQINDEKIYNTKLRADYNDMLDINTQENSLREKEFNDIKKSSNELRTEYANLTYKNNMLHDKIIKEKENYKTQKDDIMTKILFETEKIKEYKIRIQELSQSIKINYNVSPGDCCEEVNTLLSKLKNIASLSSDLYDQKLKSREFELLVNKIISENKKLKISIYENTNTISINSLKKELEQEKEACENIIIKNENKINSLKNEIKTLIEENDSLTIKYNNVETENSIYKKIIDDIDQGNIDNKNRIVFFENIIETITEKKNRLSVKCKSLKTENGIFKKTIFDLESANVCLTNEYNNFKKENVNFFLYKKIIEELELELLDHKNKIFIFETTIKEMGETNDTLSFKCGNFDVYELNYKKTIAETNSEITKAMKTIENLDKIVKEQTETIYALTSKFNITEEDLYKKNKMIVEFEFDIKKYKIDLESLTKRYQIIFDDMDGLTRKNDELKKECDFYEKWKYDNYQIIDGYRKNISDMDDDIVNYKNKIELLESSLNDFRTANDGLKKECDRLNTCKVDGSISIKEFIMMKETHDISKKKVFELRQEIKKMQFQRGYITKTNT